MTWNVQHGTPLDTIERILIDLLRDGVSVFLIQEATAPGLCAMLRRHGLGVAFEAPEFVVAWRRDEWTAVAKRGHVLSPTPYGRNRRSRAVSAILCDRQGRTLEALCYHTPSQVQNVNPRTDRPNRVKAVRESMATLKTIADKSHTRAVLFGGDDNVDERHGRGWDFMLAAATGLRQLVAPAGTHGTRKIDDFRVRGLVPVGAGSVRPGGGDHRAHVRRFRWAGR
ncbi:hypothetical protein [Nocardioides ochotonae]|uniref:hypothetical protein n=1 Tax=Nocardioides ochotonae TaxID=2685869 RepID=UPI00140943E8|nr:hypothetical protein [Nocardioides ochotonae]